MFPVSPPHSSSTLRIQSWLSEVSPRERRRRLKRRTLDMAGEPQTPTSSARKRSRIEVENAYDSGVHLPSSQHVSSSAISIKDTQTDNTRNQRSALEDHLMFFDKDSARERNQGFMDEVFDILTGKRSSVTSQRTVKNIQKAQKTYATATENKYATTVFPIICGDSRTVTCPDLLENVRAVIRFFEDDRLHCDGPCTFVKGILKGPSTKKVFGLKDPVPDMGFGIKKQEMNFAPPQVSDSTQNLIRAAGSLDHAFALCEVKGADEPFQHAVTQAMRGGITLVCTKRELRSRAGYPTFGQNEGPYGADQHSWVFTMAWMHGYVEIFVCWHEVHPQGEVDHMHLLDCYALHRGDDISRFRRDLHNILDWGLDAGRVAGLEQMVRDIAVKKAAQK
ncbi:MAG: hypothetical protein Q9220_007603 [cf. Caloplaca sp. 1 TL-2023]